MLLQKEESKNDEMKINVTLPKNRGEEKVPSFVLRALQEYENKLTQKRNEFINSKSIQIKKFEDELSNFLNNNDIMKELVKEYEKSGIGYSEFVDSIIGENKKHFIDETDKYTDEINKISKYIDSHKFEDDNVEISIPLQKCDGEPNKNMRIYNNEAFKKRWEEVK